MKVLHESIGAYVKKCENCGAVLQYSLHDIHSEETPHFNKDGKLIGYAGFESILCHCCDSIIPASREGVYDIKSLLDKLIK